MRLGLSDQALSKKLGGANLTLGALFEYCEALGKEFDIAYRDKGVRRSSQETESTLAGAYVFDLSQRVKARPPVTLRTENDAANDVWSPLKEVVRA